MGICFLTAVLFISSVGAATYDNPEMHGTCLTASGTMSIHIEPSQHELVLTRKYDVFRVPLPTEEGEYDFTYYFGQEFAKLEPGGKLLVRRGPKGMY